MKYNMIKSNSTFDSLDYNNLDQMKQRIQHKKFVNIKINNDSIRNKID